MLPGQLLPGQMSPGQLSSVKDGPRNLHSNLVKITLVTAEMFLIWANVAKTNVAWTYVTVTLRICSRPSQKATFKVSSKLGK